MAVLVSIVVVVVAIVAFVVVVVVVVVVVDDDADADAGNVVLQHCQLYQPALLFNHSVLSCDSFMNFLLCYRTAAGLYLK